MTGRPEQPAAGHDGRAGAAGGVLALADRTDRAIGLLCRVVIVSTGVTLTAVMTANVAARYMLSTGGFRWAQELPMLLFPWFIVAGIALAAQGGSHMAVEWLYDKVQERGKAAVFLFSHVCAAASFLVLAYQSTVVAGIAGIERSPILRLPNSIGYYALALGAALVALVTLLAALRVAILGWAARPRSNVEEMPL
ncbi:MAG: TRAP transporter small permease [Xanthobacteraceae bacterium]